jgi:hypothetical protein
MTKQERNMDEQTITNAYERLARSKQALWQAAEKVTARRIALERAQAIALVSGEIAGRNEAERQAQARERLHGEYAELEAAETEERHARLAYDLDRMEVERIDMILRWLSISAKP